MLDIRRVHTREAFLVPLNSGECRASSTSAKMGISGLRWVSIVTTDTATLSLLGSSCPVLETMACRASFALARWYVSSDMGPPQAKLTLRPSKGKAWIWSVTATNPSLRWLGSCRNLATI